MPLTQRSKWGWNSSFLSAASSTTTPDPVLTLLPEPPVEMDLLWEAEVSQPRVCTINAGGKPKSLIRPATAWEQYSFLLVPLVYCPSFKLQPLETLSFNDNPSHIHTQVQVFCLCISSGMLAAFSLTLSLSLALSAIYLDFWPSDLTGQVLPVKVYHLLTALCWSVMKIYVTSGKPPSPV